MPLRGRTEDFGLADALQLIVKTGRSGTMRCEGEADEIVMVLVDGWVVRVDTEGRPSDARLGTRLVRAGLLTHAELGSALALRARTGEPIAEILVNSNYATPETVRQYATLQATDLVFEAFTWRSGAYAFEDGGDLAPSPWVEPISLDWVLMQGIVLINEWPTVTERIPSSALTIDERWAVPPESEVEELDLFGQTSDIEGAEPVGPNERMVHELCVPGTDVQTVVDRAPFNRFETFRALSSLIAGRYVRLAAR